MTPAFSQARISRSTRTSPTRRPTNCISSSWSLVPREDARDTDAGFDCFEVQKRTVFCHSFGAWQE